MSKEANYIIPAKYRRMENMHIVFWIIKDISWCLSLKWLGILMVVPTLTVALLITWRTRRIVSELAHNLAVALWIIANSYWMISEFFEFDTVIITGTITGKHLALIPFIAGSLILMYYYLMQRPKEMKKESSATTTL